MEIVPKEKGRDVQKEHSIPLEILDDLSSRFIINVPGEERKDLIRICFQIELAHWFYLDFYCPDEAKLKPCGMKEFTAHIFQHIPFLRPHANNVDKVLEEWREYKQNVPTYGAILLNEDLTHVLLVQSYWAKSSWGFPKGKVNKEEEPTHCAIREVLEETGFDISNLIDPNEFIESCINDQLVRLYIITGVQLNTKFQPRTRYEIKAVEWFPIADLPSNKKDMTPKHKIGVGPNAFFMVLPFLRKVKRWIYDKQQYKVTPASPRGRRQRHKSMGELEMSSSNSVSAGSKSKKHHTSFVTTSEEDFSKGKLTSLSPTRNNNGNGNTITRKDRKQCFKRRLFFNPDTDKTRASSTPRTGKNPSPTHRSTSPNSIFRAQSWVNFKFDKQAILQIFTN